MRFINGYQLFQLIILLSTHYIIINLNTVAIISQMNCVQTNLFMPYLCHVNLLTLIMCNKSNKKETMTNTSRDFKQAEKIHSHCHQ